jgi:hypothetical protein
MIENKIIMMPFLPDSVGAKKGQGVFKLNRLFILKLERLRLRALQISIEDLI